MAFLAFWDAFDLLDFIFLHLSLGLSFYVNCYFQSDSLKSNSLTSEAEGGCHKVVFGLKMIS